MPWYGTVWLSGSGRHYHLRNYGFPTDFLVLSTSRVLCNLVKVQPVVCTKSV